METQSVLELIKGFHRTSYGRALYQELVKSPSWPFIFQRLRLDYIAGHRIHFHYRGGRPCSLFIREHKLLITHKSHYSFFGSYTGWIRTDDPKEIVFALIKQLL